MQIDVKIITAILFSVPTSVIGVILTCTALSCDILLILACTAASVMASVATVYLGVLFDAMHPKLVWEDELSALRGNMSTFLHMAVAIAAGIVMAVLYVLCGGFLIVPLLLAVLAAVTAVIIVYSSRRTEKLLAEMTV